MLALILARRVSKGITKKNLVPLLERPLVTHNAEHAKRPKKITRVLENCATAGAMKRRTRWKALEAIF